MSTAHSMIEPIVNRYFGNIFHHHNGPNQRKNIHKNISQHYQPRSYQIPSTSSIPYLKEDCLVCVISNKVVRKFLMQDNGELDTCTFRGPYFINKKEYREQILQNNHKNRSRPKTFNKKIDTSNTDPPRATISPHQPKVNSVRFEDLY